MDSKGTKESRSDRSRQAFCNESAKSASIQAESEFSKVCQELDS